MPTTFSPQDFVAKWRQTTLKERSAAQEHFIDLCKLVGHQTPAELDPAGDFFTFEAGVSKQRGGQGWADVWKKGYFAWEYKGKHADLKKAYQQLLQYREALQNPPLLVVSDIDQIEIHTNFTNSVKQVYTITLDSLLTTAGQKQLRDIFYDPSAFHTQQSTEQVTRKAADEFKKLADLLRQWYKDEADASHRIAHFLIRLLFCLFAEDIGLLPNNVFTRLVQQTRTRPGVFAEQLRQLFRTMAKGGVFALEDIPYFNGRLFDDDSVLELDSDGLITLARVSNLDWSSIEPAILGTLFERIIDPVKRSQLGMHYTGKDDILLIVEPVLMVPLRRRWAAIQEQSRGLVERRDAASGAQRTRLENELRGLLTGFAQELAELRVLDPACGSGNFLYVALKQLLDLEKEVITFAGDIGVGRFFPSVSPEQLHGIELNEYAHELAQITVWIGYIQWLRDNGFGQPSQPILKPLDTIRHMDAILAFEHEGKPIEPEWPRANVIIGNPPFLGGKRMRTELGDEYVETIFALYNGRVPGEADLVTYWFERTRALIEADIVKRAGLLATQGIRGGANRKVLERIKGTGDIFMAWSDRNWILDGAAVHVSMVGFDDGSELLRMLDGTPVQTINPNLTSALNLTTAQRLKENLNLAYMGDTKGGAFDLSPEVAVTMLSAPLNPNARTNQDVLRPWVNGLDVTRRPRGIWIIDFGVTMPEEAAALYELPFRHVVREVKPERMKNKRAVYRERWWIHAEPRPALRVALAPLKRYIATPNLTKHRLFAWLEPPTLPDHQLIVFARDDDYFFGILHSKVHELWARAMGTQLREVESGFRYTPTTTFETFPCPWPPGQEPQGDPRIGAIAQAARDLVEKRDRWLNPPGASEAELKKRTLTNLYNERPAWLDISHRKLDQAVLDAYGWPHDVTDEQILERLLALNLERAATHGAQVALSSVDDEDGE